ncbi:molybdopterin-dependent oxidoreductase [Streptomyces sp. B6B3]|uniref:molybdopterin-dependent oxidoreductase n=1 Tax=Streptomyces sp. B6B3 TaxID=3153570 RepID=UPI00325C78AC
MRRETLTDADRAASAVAERLLRAGSRLRRATAGADPRDDRADARTGRDQGEQDHRDHTGLRDPTDPPDPPASADRRDHPDATDATDPTDHDAGSGHRARGPRAAAVSRDTYAPTRVRYPHARGVLLELYREARERRGDPVAAWAELTGDPDKRRRYQSARGKGGLVRIGWDEALEIAAAAHVHALQRYGPDRIAGFSPAPTLAMASHAVGARFMALLGAPMLSSQDWQAELPIAAPQMFGDRADGPEPGDWWDAAHLTLLGSDAPAGVTPAPSPEGRRRDQRVVVLSSDHSEAARIADEWLRPHPGTDGAVAMAMGQVVLREFFVERQVPYFVDYVSRFTDLPFLVDLRQLDGSPDRYAPGRFVTAADADLGVDLGEPRPAAGLRLGQHADAAARRWMPVVFDEETGRPAVPNGTLGDRWSSGGEGRWNLDLDGLRPTLTFHPGPFAAGVPVGETAEVVLPRFEEPGGVVRRGVPVRRLGDRLVTTVFDLLLAQYGVARPGLPGRWPHGYEDASAPGTPAWQEAITSVPAAAVVRTAREFAGTAERTRGRCMMVMGAGSNRWFHADTSCRAFLTLLLLTGCQGVRGGGWAHHAGQRKVRPFAGWQQLASAADWVRPPRQMAGTPYWYLHTDQWRYERYGADALASPTGRGLFAGRHTADLVAQSMRLGWMPSYPTFGENPLDLGRRIHRSGQPAAEWVAEQLAAGKLRFACEDPDAPENWPRVLTVWRTDLFGPSATGHEFFLRHLLGADDNARAEEAAPRQRPADVTWHARAPRGKLDLLLALDVHLTPTAMLADLVLPAATAAERHDLASADAEPYVRAVEPAIDPPWQTRTEFAIFHGLARAVSELAAGRLENTHDLVATALRHDTPGEAAQPGGTVPDWRVGAPPGPSGPGGGAAAAVPGRNLPHVSLVERDYTTLADRLATFGPLAEIAGMTVKGVRVDPSPESAWLAAHCGTAAGGSAAGRPLLDTDVKLCEAILALSGTTNGRLAAEGFRQLTERCGPGSGLTELGAADADRRVAFADVRARPSRAGTSFEWSGKETLDHGYTPFTIHTEHGKPWHTLTGRQHLYLDHDWIAELGEQLPVYRPPLNLAALGEATLAAPGKGREVNVRYLTPHATWAAHSEHQESLVAQTLARGGPVIWLSVPDAAAIGVADQDWTEAVSAGGVVVARAMVSHRMPIGTVYVHQVRDRPARAPLPDPHPAAQARRHAQPVPAARRAAASPEVANRLLVKPSHLVGGYGQLSFAPNYYGPTGNQRDPVTVVRRCSAQEAPR